MAVNAVIATYLFMKVEDSLESNKFNNKMLIFWFLIIENIKIWTSDNLVLSKTQSKIAKRNLLLVFILVIKILTYL